MIARRATMAVAAWLALCAGAAARQVEDLGERLAALRPEEPLAYFELGEEVASEMRDEEGRALARTLYVLAYTLDRRNGGRLGGSVCLALSEIETREQQRRLLGALAAALGERGVIAEPTRGSAGVDESAYSLATALGHYRSGQYDRAAAALDRPEVAALLERYGDLLGGAATIQREVRAKPSCRECRNTRIVRSEFDPAGEYRLCYTCGGDPGPGLTEPETAAQLRVESILLSDRAGSWSAQIVADKGAPLRELDPEEIAPLYGVDPSKTVWRDGRWTAPAGPAGAGAPAEGVGSTGGGGRP